MLKNRYSISNGGMRRRSSSNDVSAKTMSAVKLQRGANALLESATEASGRSSVTANAFTNMTPTNVPVSTMPVGGVAYNHMFTGILPESEESLLPYYRDCYYYDPVAGSAVDLSSSIPFSDWTLTGLANDEIEIYSESLARMNMRSLLPEISNAYLVDGAFIGSLVYEQRSKVFQDILIHDRLNCSITLQPFFSVDPIITANAANYLSQFYHSNSPYVRAITDQYPKGFIDAFMQGAVVLDPITTIYIPRRGLQNKANVSYLKRVLPAYMFEKILFRGTLIEASKRMRATTHLQIGDDVWEPTTGEMQTILEQFQMSELDPLGAWVATRNGVQIQDVRQAGEFWKWTDVMDNLVPYKLRALGISEAFLSGDTNYSNSETALSVFMDNMDAYRQFVTYRLFTNKIFPLIAVLNGMFKDKSKVLKMNSVSNLMLNLNNHKNLKIPEIKWHKNLRQIDSAYTDMLDKLSGIGLPIPLKMWAAAANIDISTLMNDVTEDQELRKAIKAVKGSDKPESHEEDYGYEDASVKSAVDRLEIRPGSSDNLTRRRPFASREFSPTPMVAKSKSGKVNHAVYNEAAKQKSVNANIVKAMKALSDPHRRNEIRKKVVAKLGRVPNILY